MRIIRKDKDVRQAIRIRAEILIIIIKIKDLLI